MKKKSQREKESDERPVHAALFSLSFLDDDPSDKHDLPPYEYELLTAEEKANYFERKAANGGKENDSEVAADCKKRAAALRKKASRLNTDAAQPLIEHASRLEAHARQLEDVIPPEVLESQIPFEATGILVEGSSKHKKGFDLTGWLSEFLPKTDVEKSDFWRNIHRWTPQEQMLYYFAKPESVLRAEVLFVRAQQDPNALRFLKSDAQLGIERLLDLASLGNTKAAEEAVKIIDHLVRRLALYTRAYPETFIPVARALIEWPVIYSTLPKLQQKPEDLKATIQLTEDYPFGVHSQAKWDPREPACKIVLELFKYINTMRTKPEDFSHFPYSKAAKALPPIGEDTAWEKWWTVARDVLQYGRESLANEPHLSGMVTGAATRKYKSRIEQRILARLKSRFKKLFPKEKR